MQVLVLSAARGGVRGHVGETTKPVSLRLTSMTLLRHHRTLGARRLVVAVSLAVLAHRPRRLPTQSKTTVDRRHRHLCRATGVQRRSLDITSAVGQPSTGRTVLPSDQGPRQTLGAGCRRSDALKCLVTIYWTSYSSRIEDRVHATAALLSTTALRVEWAVFVVDVGR